MQSEPMKIVKDGETIHVMPEMLCMGKVFKDFACEADETIAKLKKSELEAAIKKQADVMKFLEGMLHGE